MPAGLGAAYASGAGLLGALAASSAKMALGADYLQEGCVAFLGGEGTATDACAWRSREEAYDGLRRRLTISRGLYFTCGEIPPCAIFSYHFEKLPMVLRAGCGAVMLACNAIMWTFFAKALRYSSSSAAATVTSTAANFISSTFLGKLLFGETHALLWWIGISVILLGLLLLHTGPSLLGEQKDLKGKMK